MQTADILPMQRHDMVNGVQNPAIFGQPTSRRIKLFDLGVLLRGQPIWASKSFPRIIPCCGCRIFIGIGRFPDFLHRQVIEAIIRRPFQRGAALNLGVFLPIVSLLLNILFAARMILVVLAFAFGFISGLPISQVTRTAPSIQAVVGLFTFSELVDRFGLAAFSANLHAPVLTPTSVRASLFLAKVFIMLPDAVGIARLAHGCGTSSNALRAAEGLSRPSL